jgi:hypothetical protein
MPYDDFISNTRDALALIDIADQTDDQVSAQLICRSSIVLVIAYWQNYNERLLLDFSEVLRQRARQGDDLPQKVRKEIGKWVLREQNIHAHPEKAALLIWQYASGRWRDDYGEFVEDKTEKLNTPNSKNLQSLYQAILGIDEIAAEWSSDSLDDVTAAEYLDAFLDKRHEIAHGAFSGELDTTDIRNQIAFLSTIAQDTYIASSNHMAEILEGIGRHWNLNSFNLTGLIRWVADLPEPRTFAVSNLAEINRQWYANHRKLEYPAWGLLQGPSNRRTTTENFEMFLSGEVKLPYEIISFGGNDAILKPGTRMISYDELDDLTRS